MDTGAGYAPGPDVRRAAFPARARQPENIAEREREGASPRSLSVLRAPATPLRRRCAPTTGADRSAETAPEARPRQAGLLLRLRVVPPYALPFP